jgi:hypothetical protein
LILEVDYYVERDHTPSMYTNILIRERKRGHAEGEISVNAKEALAQRPSASIEGRIG